MAAAETVTDLERAIRNDETQLHDLRRKIAATQDRISNAEKRLKSSEASVEFCRDSLEKLLGPEAAVVELFDENGQPGHYQKMRKLHVDSIDFVDRLKIEIETMHNKLASFLADVERTGVRIEKARHDLADFGRVIPFRR